MPEPQPYRRLFLLAGVLHVLAGVAGLIALPQAFPPLGIWERTPGIFWQIACAVTACFGLAGFWIAADARRNRDLIQLWLCVKVAASVLVLWHLRLHHLGAWAGSLVVVDAGWIAVFTSILVRLGGERTP